MSVKVVAFLPAGKATVALAANTASSTATYQNVLTGGAHNVRIYNSGPNDCAVEFGDSTVSATFPLGSTASSMVLAASTVEVFTARASTIAAICTGASATSTLFITPGDGV